MLRGAVREFVQALVLNSVDGPRCHCCRRILTTSSRVLHNTDVAGLERGLFKRNHAAHVQAPSRLSQPTQLFFFLTPFSSSGCCRGTRSHGGHAVFLEQNYPTAYQGSPGHAGICRQLGLVRHDNYQPIATRPGNTITLPIPRRSSAVMAD
jgi:hypothetical protein